MAFRNQGAHSPGLCEPEPSLASAREAADEAQPAKVAIVTSEWIELARVASTLLERLTIASARSRPQTS